MVPRSLLAGPAGRLALQFLYEGSCGEGVRGFRSSNKWAASSFAFLAGDRAVAGQPTPGSVALLVWKLVQLLGLPYSTLASPGLLQRGHFVLLFGRPVQGRNSMLPCL